MEEKASVTKKYQFRETPKAVRILFAILKYAVLIFACLLVLIPLIVVLFGAFKSHKEFLTSGAFDLPTSLNFDNFATAFIKGLRCGRRTSIFTGIPAGAAGRRPMAKTRI